MLTSIREPFRQMLHTIWQRQQPKWLNSPNTPLKTSPCLAYCWGRLSYYWLHRVLLRTKLRFLPPSPHQLHLHQSPHHHPHFCRRHRLHCPLFPLPQYRHLLLLPLLLPLLHPLLNLPQNVMRFPSSTTPPTAPTGGTTPTGSPTSPSTSGSASPPTPTPE